MDEQTWETAVVLAMRDGNREGLKELFDQAVQAWGRETAGARWFAVLSGSDASAQTG